MIIHRGYKVELDPNNTQQSALVNHAGAARHVWNWGLETKQRAYKETGESPGAIELHRKLNELKKIPKSQDGKPWLYEVSKCAGQEALRNLDQAFTNFFRRCREGAKKKGYPKFKSRKKGLGSFRLRGAVQAVKTHVQLPRLGKIKLKERSYLPTPEDKHVKVLSATVSEKAGKWFVSFSVEQEIPDSRPKAKAKSIGVDVGVTNLAVCSDGTVYENPRALKRSLKRLKHLQRSVSRKKRGSRNRHKAVRRVQRLHYRIARLRADAIHKATTGIIERYDLIGIETLNVSGMLKNRCLSQSISDAAMSEFLRQVKYKAEWKGAEVIEAPRFYASSKTCSRCGHINQDLTLFSSRGRVFCCEKCGLVIDRDLNASINLESLAVSSTVTACGEASSGFGHVAKVKLASMKQEPNRRSQCVST
jgi:putative transposase